MLVTHGTDLEGLFLNPAMYSIVIPVYKNEDSIGELLNCLQHIDEQLPGSLEVVFVIDGSSDQSLHRLATMLPSAPFSSKVVVLSRNFGSFAAIRVGLEKASAKYFAVMAADLQEPPELIIGFFEALANDEADVVVGARIAREDPLFSQWASQIFWFLYRKLVQSETPKGGIDVFGCNELFRESLLKLDESHTSLVGLLLWLGFRRKLIPYRRQKRVHGKSGWTLLKRIQYLLDSAFSFSHTPIQVLFWMGLFGCTTSVVLSLVVVWARLSGRIQVPGYSPVVLTITFFGSLNLICLAIVGSYVWRAFENTKHRPGAVVMKELSFIPASQHELLRSSTRDL
jgi:glycosyltransferase involved in cell wall biosynthesis